MPARDPWRGGVRARADIRGSKGGGSRGTGGGDGDGAAAAKADGQGGWDVAGGAGDGLLRVASAQGETADFEGGGRRWRRRWRQ